MIASLIQEPPAVIPFNQINNRLKSIGKDRKWLAESSGRSWNSIRNALAPNAPDNQRTKFLAIALTEAIEREEQRQANPASDGPPAENQIVLRAGGARFDAWNQTALAKGQTLARWAESTLDSAAGHHEA